jgi:Leucine-rich repeat (LRR) protein
LANLQELSCNDNQITSLESLTGLKKLLTLHCSRNKISDSEVKKFKEKLNFD